MKNTLFDYDFDLDSFIDSIDLTVNYKDYDFDIDLYFDFEL